MKAVITFFAGILSVIAIGILLIAYGLLNPRVATADGTMMSRPMYASDRGIFPGDVAGAPSGGITYDGYGRPLAYQVSNAGPVGLGGTARAVPAVQTYDAPRPAAVSRPVSYQERPVRVVERAPQRDWKKTAMIIGGTTAAAAGLGGIFGGKKGALIGAAIGGGASTIYEVTKK
jgi:hypothetical protein